MKKLFLTIGTVLLLVGVAAAATLGLFIYPFQPAQPPSANDTGSTQQGIQQVVSANNKFAFEIFSELGKTETGNIFYSPYSISSALAMTYEGAKGQTADEMKSIFHFPDISTFRPNFAAVYNDINKKNKSYSLNTGNALWVQYDYPLLENYTSAVENYYGGKAANLGFVAETEKSRQTINSFIAEQTNSKIQNLLPQGSLNSMTRLVLTNAVYFKGTWEWEFDKSNTREQDFRITPDNAVKAQTMYMKPDKATFNYADTDGLQILELPYKGGELSMLILLPSENNSALENSLTAEKLGEYENLMKETKLDAIYLPKFKFDAEYSLNGALSAMGMPSAFSPNADFSGMTGSKELSISSVIHKAFIDVNEEGTEAAAATGVVVGITSVGGTRTIFRADHPFIFIIQQKSTGNILFMGKVTDPTK